MPTGWHQYTSLQICLLINMAALQPIVSKIVSCFPIFITTGKKQFSINKTNKWLITFRLIFCMKKVRTWPTPMWVLHDIHFSFYSINFMNAMLTSLHVTSHSSKWTRPTIYNNITFSEKSCPVLSLGHFNLVTDQCEWRLSLFVSLVGHISITQCQKTWMDEQPNYKQLTGCSYPSKILAHHRQTRWRQHRKAELNKPLTHA